MKPNPMKCGVLAAMIALAACNQDQAGDAGVDAAPEPTTTPSEAASQTPEPMPQTQPGSTTATSGTPGAAGQASVIASQTAGPGGGSYITDAAGMAVYMLEGDTGGTKCTGACVQAWPPLLATDAQPVVGAGLQADRLSTIKRPDGSTQLTYNGHPLHHYAADGGAGRTNGQGVKDQWGTWHLLSPQGDPVTAPASATQPSQ